MQKKQPQPPPSFTQLLHLVIENIPSAPQAALYQQVWHFDFKCPLVGEIPKPPEEICPKLGQISHQMKGADILREIVKNLSLRLTEEEYDRLQTIAKERGLKIEPTVRRLVAEAEIAARPPEAYTDLLHELSAIGQQINQIAYQANVQKGITDVEVSRAVALVRQVHTLIENNL